MITSSPCLHIAINASLVRNEGSRTCNLYRSLLNSFKNGVPRPSGAFILQPEWSNINREPIVLIRGYLATSVFGEAVEELYVKADQFINSL